MADTAQVLSISIPTLAVLIGILVNNSRLSDLRAQVDVRNNDLRAHMDQRFSDLEARFTGSLLRVEQVMDARLKHLEENRH